MFKCECGFESPSKAGLASHQRACKELKKKEEFAIVDGGDNVIRVYSVKVHGKDAGKLAEMFSKQYNNYQIK